ncbi:putative transcriptional regulator [Pleurocapsa sp. PCC 7327]|uniref:heavy metal-responsive transcriptional regulator n=1 Tax=Pleurocapsa sp. PCC 7327 TaxID=118163 RepID=UPI00029F8C61|nr:heavy metal-responsive transcriptional regulator [Pleurocapsa sp. PCC 7327]AFY76067.1 putative transcriptional regulator [Pleurocapsa sp. PCC 7327]
MNPTARIDRWLKIGEVATESGLPVKTIRYYEKLGLLTPSVERTKSGYRLFHRSVFNRLAFIKRSQSLGLTLNDIRKILSVRDAGELPCGVAKEMLLHKLELIQQQIEALEILQSELRGILSGWQDMPSREKIAQTICPNIQSEI